MQASQAHRNCARRPTSQSGAIACLMQHPRCHCTCCPPAAQPTLELVVMATMSRCSTDAAQHSSATHLTAGAHGKVEVLQMLFNLCRGQEEVTSVQADTTPLALAAPYIQLHVGINVNRVWGRPASSALKQLYVQQTILAELAEAPFSIGTSECHLLNLRCVLRTMQPLSHGLQTLLTGMCERVRRCPRAQDPAASNTSTPCARPSRIRIFRKPSRELPGKSILMSCQRSSSR